MCVRERYPSSVCISDSQEGKGGTAAKDRERHILPMCALVTGRGIKDRTTVVERETENERRSE